MPRMSRSSTTTEDKSMAAIAHPGRFLKREIAARRLSANRLALALGVPSGRAAYRRITDILNGRRAITAETAIRLGRYFGNRAQFWLDLQGQYDIATIERAGGKAIAARFGRRMRGEAKSYSDPDFTHLARARSRAYPALRRWRRARCAQLLPPAQRHPHALRPWLCHGDAGVAVRGEQEDQRGIREWARLYKLHGSTASLPRGNELTPDRDRLNGITRGDT